MSLAAVEKKVREAEFFLEHMRRCEARILGNYDEFDFFLSAFLSSSRTVDYRLRHEHGDVYRSWRDNWDAALASQDLRLIKFLVDDRNVEVHESGSTRDEKLSAFGVDMADSRVAAFVPLPAPRPGAIAKSDYYFTIDGGECKATDACAKYVGLLRSMADAFSRLLKNDRCAGRDPYWRSFGHSGGAPSAPRGPPRYRESPPCRRAPRHRSLTTAAAVVVSTGFVPR